MTDTRIDTDELRRLIEASTNPKNPFNYTFASRLQLESHLFNNALQIADELDALRGEDSAKTTLIQRIMARLADLLPEDDFNYIEALVLDLGIPYPPQKKMADTRNDYGFCAWCGEPINYRDIGIQAVRDSDGDVFHFICKALFDDEVQEGSAK